MPFPETPKVVLLRVGYLFSSKINFCLKFQVMFRFSVLEEGSNATCSTWRFDKPPNVFFGGSPHHFAPVILAKMPASPFQHRIMITEESCQLGDVCMFGVQRWEDVGFQPVTSSYHRNSCLTIHAPNSFFWFPITSHQRNCQEFAPCTSHRSVLQTHLHERWDLLTGWQGSFPPFALWWYQAFAIATLGITTFWLKLCVSKAGENNLAKLWTSTKTVGIQVVFPKN